jgi:hypothetical protein
MDWIRTDNDFIISVFVIIFQIWIVRIRIRIRYSMDIWIRIGYRADTNTNMDIFQILNKNIICIIKKIIAYYFLIESLIIKLNINYYYINSSNVSMNYKKNGTLTQIRYKIN